jgi:pimeloyl-ACP methyl ester carboxylesterase
MVRSGVTPEIRYAKSGDVHIAYQTFGQGAKDIVIIPGFISHIEHVWDSPDQSRWLNHLGRLARVTLFDKRGTGLSDRLGQLPNLDQRMDDARAVMDAANIERAATMGVSEGGSLATLFAAREVERTQTDVLGIAVHVAARVMDRAQDGEVMISRTVKDLVAGSGMKFDDAGEHALKGVEEKWQLYKVRETA